MTRLEQLARDLRAARQAEREAKKFIEANQAEYMALLTEYIGPGQVTFDYDGYRYGRVIAEKATLDIPRLQAEHPEIADSVLRSKTTWSLDEDALNNYLAHQPEETALIQSYITTTEEPRWKNPVVAKEDE